MSIFSRTFSIVLTVIPALVAWQFVVLTMGGQYYEAPYLLTSYFFLAVSLLLGLSVPVLLPASWKRHPSIWLFAQGLLAWLAAALCLCLLNLTPLCVGQENGDGTNTLSMCNAQTVIVSLVYSPLECSTLLLAALPGGWLIKKWLGRKI
jgi:hypothetical protein